MFVIHRPQMSLFRQEQIRWFASLGESQLDTKIARYEDNLTMQRHVWAIPENEKGSVPLDGSMFLVQVTFVTPNTFGTWRWLEESLTFSKVLFEILKWDISCKIAREDGDRTVLAMFQKITSPLAKKNETFLVYGRTVSFRWYPAWYSINKCFFTINDKLVFIIFRLKFCCRTLQWGFCRFYVFWFKIFIEQKCKSFGVLLSPKTALLHSQAPSSNGPVQEHRIKLILGTVCR